MYITVKFESRLRKKIYEFMTFYFGIQDKQIGM